MKITIEQSPEKLHEPKPMGYHAELRIDDNPHNFVDIYSHDEEMIKKMTALLGNADLMLDRLKEVNQLLKTMIGLEILDAEAWQDFMAKNEQTIKAAQEL